MKFLIAYDIGSPRRLRKVAHCLERSAQRVQKSVFVFEGPGYQMNAILDELASIIDGQIDRIQAWPLGESRNLSRRDIGTAGPSHVLCTVVTPDEHIVLEDPITREYFQEITL